MTAENFTYWLHGFFEIGNTDTLTKKQIKTIKDHLDLVFEKVTAKPSVFKKIIPDEPFKDILNRSSGNNNGLLC